VALSFLGDEASHEHDELVGEKRARTRLVPAEIMRFSPSLYQYISHLHIAVSGFIAATALAASSSRHGSECGDACCGRGSEQLQPLS
jgi:hypothetical protein